ncbi:PAS domain-containing sensor histidine kinase [Novosphingobium sp.]|uniref:PAS domain-containing sensor histidine kinase n=1 Tax=Novosphingobium sp. TaxID=1874826 RepID=UPI002FE1197C
MTSAPDFPESDPGTQAHRYHRIFEATVVAFWEIDLADMQAMLAERCRETGLEPADYVRANPAFIRQSIDTCRVLDLNTRAQVLFGVDRETALATPFGHWCPPQAETMLFDNLVAYLTGEAGYEGEALMMRADGSLFPVHVSTAFPQEPVSPPAGTFAIMDISDRIEREEALARLNTELIRAARVATLGELAASIAHEVNQPLTALVANGNAALRWLRRPTPDLEEAIDAISRIVEDGTRASEVLARTRRMATKGDGDRAPHDLATIIDEALAISRWQLGSLGAEVDVDIAAGVGRVQVDKVQIQQVLINLLVNAAQAMTAIPAPRRIALSARVEGTFMVVHVDDQGPGIPETLGQQIFNAFYTTRPGGMGMGLSITRTIVEAHGGSILATAAAGGGASFRFTLPRAG